MKLYLVQHGEAVAKEVDPDRPLSTQGHDDVTRLATFVHGKLGPARICHSGKTRARQTAELLAATLAPEVPIEVLGGIGPNDPIAPLVARLEELGDEVLLVGHLPFVARLAAVLVTGRETPSVVDYRPGSMLCLGSDGEGKWTIQWMLRPEVVRG